MIDEDRFFALLIILIIIIVMSFVTSVLIIGAMYVDAIEKTRIAEENCRIMNVNGHTTKLEEVDNIGFNILDCYIKIESGKYVPYDRFRGIE